jgi:hypothetical protein
MIDDLHNNNLIVKHITSIVLVVRLSVGTKDFLLQVPEKAW